MEVWDDSTWPTNEQPQGNLHSVAWISMVSTTLILINHLLIHVKDKLSNSFLLWCFYLDMSSNYS